MKGKMIRLVAAFLAIICLFLSGCAVTDAPEKPTKKETLVIGSDIYSPYFYLDDNGDFAGIDVEIAGEACRRLGVTPEFRQISWQNKDAYLKDGAVDCLWGCFSMNGREADYAWAGPYMYSRQVVVVKASSDIRTLKDLNGKYIAVQNASKPDELFSNDAVNGVSVKKVYSFATISDVFAALKKEYVDAYAGHETACLDHIRNISGEYRVLDEALLSADLGVAFDRETGAKRAGQLTAVLTEMKDDGTIRKILEKYSLDIDFALKGNEK